MSLRYRYQKYEIGNVDIRLQILRDLSQFSDTDGNMKAADISQDAFPLFGIVWASSEVLARLMRGYDITGKRILEVGCGMALVSHLLNARGADITAMDIRPITGKLLSTNTDLNDASPIPYVNASWGDDSPGLGQFDLIVGSDILYEPKHVSTLAPFLDKHALVRSEVLIVDPNRGQSEVFEQAMSDIGFSCESYEPEFTDHLGVAYKGWVHRYFR